MASHQDELSAAHVSCDRALAEWAGLKEHMVQHFANVQMSNMWEALAHEKAYARWVNLWCVLVLLRTYCPAEVAVECAMSLCWRYSTSTQDIVETHVLSMCMALHSNLPPLQQWAKGPGIAVARPLVASAHFDLRPRRRVSQQVNARESVEATMLQCLQGIEAVADDGDILPFFGGPGAPLTSTSTQRHRAHVVTVVALHGTPESHAGNHDFITLHRGMQCATCRQVIRASFAGQHPCAEVVVNVADDVFEEGENNSAHELATPHKLDKRRGVATMEAKLVMAAQNGKLRDWTRVALSHCFDVLGVKVPSGTNRRQTRDLAMQHALPLLAQWDAFVPDTERVTRSTAPPSSSQPCCSQPVDDMD